MAYFLDLYNGDPLSGGVSVLARLTGSAVRPAIVMQTMTVYPFPGLRLTNPLTFTVTTSALAVTNITHVALYDAATAGTRLYSERVGASPSIGKGTLVQFNGLDLAFQVAQNAIVTVTLAANEAIVFTINATLTVHGGGGSGGQWVFNQTSQSGELLTCGVF